MIRNQFYKLGKGKGKNFFLCLGAKKQKGYIRIFWINGAKAGQKEVIPKDTPVTVHRLKNYKDVEHILSKYENNFVRSSKGGVIFVSETCKVWEAQDFGIFFFTRVWNWGNLERQIETDTITLATLILDDRQEVPKPLHWGKYLDALAVCEMFLKTGKKPNAVFGTQTITDAEYEEYFV